MKAANGKEIKLYYPDGTIIPSIEEFTNFYSKCYYLDNNKEVEDVIDNILKNGIHSPVELFRVLAWEFRKINMRKSKGTDFKYKGNLNEENKQLQIPYKNDIIDKSDIEEIYNKIIKPTKKCDSDKEAQNFLIKLRKLTDKKGWGKNFGSVYMISLLYFVSKRRYPIVNSSSYVAVDAIYNNEDFGTKISTKDF